LSVLQNPQPAVFALHKRVEYLISYICGILFVYYNSFIVPADLNISVRIGLLVSATYSWVAFLIQW